MSSYLTYGIEVKQSNDSWKAVMFNGKVWHNSLQGMVRDHLSSHGWFDCPFTSRGMPANVSEEMKKSFDYGDGLNRQFSYATLQEILNYAETLETELKRKLDNIENEEFLKKLRYIHNKDTQDLTINVISDSLSDPEKLEDDWWSQLHFHEFYGRLSEAAEIFNNDDCWVHESDVRIIFYIG